MGARRKEIDVNLMLDMLSEGISKKEIGETLGVSVPTIEANIERLGKEEQSLMAYSKVQHLELIGIQRRIACGVTDTKIDAADLGELASAFKIFKQAEQLVQGKPTEIHGLMGFLMALEKEDIEKAQAPEAETVETTVEDVTKEMTNALQKA
jgi:hypothetical protein